MKFRKLISPMFYFEGDDGGTPVVTDPPAGTTPPKTYDEAFVSKLQGERDANATALKEAQAKLKAADDLNKTELQKAQDRVKELEARSATLEAQHAAAASREAFVNAATVARAKNPGTVAKLLQSEGIKGAETGTPDATQLKAALDSLIKSDPDLFSPVGPRGNDAGAGLGSAKTSGNDFIRGIITAKGL